MMTPITSAVACGYNCFALAKKTIAIGHGAVADRENEFVFKVGSKERRTIMTDEEHKVVSHLLKRCVEIEE